MVLAFFRDLAEIKHDKVFLSVMTIGELRRGVALVRHRGDLEQAAVLESWLGTVVGRYAAPLLDISAEEAQVWAMLRTPRHENAIDKLIAATALTHGLTLVSRNARHFAFPDLATLNPFTD